MEQLSFAQFAVSYYRKKAEQQVTLDPDTGVGKDSEEPIVGGGDLRAPLSMSLSNNIVMKKRSDRSNAILLLLNYNALDSYGERMMFQPWRTLQELVDDQSFEDKQMQRYNSLQLFPMGIFPKMD